MEISKGHWTSDGSNIRLSMSITKIDQQNRLVSGWASLDNVDSQGDVVLQEANAKAFSRFRGNIREMHQPIAAGRMVDFKEDVYYDPETQKFYNGIYVTVYISLGAQDTWEKILDGTLSGFSIGGAVIDSESQWVSDANRVIRFIKDYELVELSLVDNPANQLANVVSITKAADGSTIVKGMIADTKSENVFWCGADKAAKTSADDSAVCPNGHTMQNIGWIEYADDSAKTEKVRAVVDSHISSNTSSAEAEIAKQEEPANNEGGVDVAEETETVVATDEANEATVEGAPQTEAEHSVDAVESNAEVATDAVEEQPEETVEKAADVSEVEAEEPDFAKMFGDLKETIVSGLEKNATSAAEAVEKATKAFESKISELAAKHDELTTKFDSLKSELDSVEKRIDGVEGETAVKKSGDLGGSKEDTLAKGKESIWGGHFLSLTDL